MQPGEIFEPKPDRRNVGEPKKRPITAEEWKAIADYYEAGLRIGKTSDELLSELEERFARDARTFQYHIREQRELRETSRQSRLSQHYEDLAYTASILARNAGYLNGWKGTYEHSMGDVVVGVDPMAKGAPYVLGFSLPDPSTFWRAPPKMANLYSADCLLAHFNETYPDLRIEDWRSLTIESVSQDVVDALESLGMPARFKAVPGCQVCEFLQKSD